MTHGSLSIVLFSSNKGLLLKKADMLTSTRRLQVSGQGSDYVLLTPVMP